MPTCSYCLKQLASCDVLDFGDAAFHFDCEALAAMATGATRGRALGEVLKALGGVRSVHRAVWNRMASTSAGETSDLFNVIESAIVDAPDLGPHQRQLALRLSTAWRWRCEQLMSTAPIASSSIALGRRAHED